MVKDCIIDNRMWENVGTFTTNIAAETDRSTIHGCEDIKLQLKIYRCFELGCLQ